MKEKSEKTTPTTSIKPPPQEGLYSIKQVAEKTGRNIRTIRTWAKKLGIQLVHGRIYFTQTQLNAKLPPENAYTPAEAAEKAGITIATLYVQAKKLGIPRIAGRWFFTETQLTTILKAGKKCPPPKGFYTTKQAAEKAGTSISSIYQRAKELGMPHRSGRRFFTEAEVNAMIKAAKRQPPPEGLYTAKQAAKKAGKSISIIYFWAKRLGIRHINGRRFFTETEIHAMKEAGKIQPPRNGVYTTNQVAEKTGMLIHSIRRWARKRGIPRENGSFYFTEADIQKITTLVSGKK